MLQSEPGPVAHFPVSALATRWGLGGALGFVPLKASRMGGTTTGNIMPVDGDAKVEKKNHRPFGRSSRGGARVWKTTTSESQFACSDNQDDARRQSPALHRPPVMNNPRVGSGGARRKTLPYAQRL